jgi:hypothetical protein
MKKAYNFGKKPLRKRRSIAPDRIQRRGNPIEITHSRFPAPIGRQKSKRSYRSDKSKNLLLSGQVCKKGQAKPALFWRKIMEPPNRHVLPSVCSAVCCATQLRYADNPTPQIGFSTAFLQKRKNRVLPFLQINPSLIREGPGVGLPGKK